jgi:hypothetical protein
VKARARAATRAPAAEPATRVAELTGRLGEAEAESEEEEPEPELLPPVAVAEEPEAELEAAPEAEAEAEALLDLGLVEGRTPLVTAAEVGRAEEPAGELAEPEPEPDPEAPEPEPELEPEPDPELEAAESEPELEPEPDPELEAAESEPETPEPEPEASEPAEPVGEAEVAEETKPDFSAIPAPEVLEEAAAELEDVEALQLKSYRGVVSVEEPVTPKLGAVVPASSRMYHQVLVVPNRGQATSSQYCLALAVLATARFSVGPVTGQPVSVIQTSLPPATALVFSTPFSKRALASSMELGSVFS